MAVKRNTTIEMSEDFKELINEKFSNVHKTMNQHHEIIQLQMRTITEKIDKSDAEAKTMGGLIDTLVKDSLRHHASCPNTKEIVKLHEKIDQNKDELDEKLLEVNFVRKFPKFIIAGLAVAVLVILFTVYEAVMSYNEIINRVQSSQQIQPK